jgi:hypothetical protein
VRVWYGWGMRRRPFAVIAVLVSVYCYLLVRELGHLISAAVLGMPTDLVVQYLVVPTWQAGPEVFSMSARGRAFFIVASPVLTLLAGYAALGLISRWGARLRGAFTRLVPAVLCYAMLILDPIYYSIIPILRLGGEPAAVARLLGIPRLAVVIPAAVLLIVNVILLRRSLGAFLREGR